MSEERFINVGGNSLRVLIDGTPPSPMAHLPAWRGDQCAFVGSADRAFGTPVPYPQDRRARARQIDCRCCRQDL